MAIDEAFNFKSIDSLHSTAGQLTEQQLRTLGAENYRAVINLLPAESEYAVKNEAIILRDQGIFYTHIPIDFANPTPEDYREFERAMTGFSNQKTLVHCAANYRASAFYAIYACTHRGWRVEHALALIDTIWDLDEYPVWSEFVHRMLDSVKQRKT